MSPVLIAAVCAAPVLVLDQLVKQLVLRLLEQADGHQIVVIPSLFNLVEVWNAGVSFGMLGGAGLPPWVLTAVSLVICVALGWWVWRGLPRLPAAAVGLVIGGAIGNVIDRLRWGGVFDFADFHVGKWHWPAFNVADAAIVIGVGLLLIDSLFLERRRAV
jgi:signal peptidase II